jgi:outer membrane protein OmpA-like peptidoglycan-associated protein
VGGDLSPETTAYKEGNYIYLRGNDVKEGQEYQLLRHMQDPNRYESFKGQEKAVGALGEMYQDLGRAKVEYIRNKVGVAKIEMACAPALTGDIAVPFSERPRPEFRHVAYNEFATPSGKTAGRIVEAKDLDTFIGLHRIVYLNVGEQQGVKPGDYFRITRNYQSVLDSPSESLPLSAPAADDTQKDVPKYNFRKLAGELPIRTVGHLMILSVTPTTATGLTTYVNEDVHLGDGVEMIDVAAEAPEAAPSAAPPATPPQPPTIQCSASRNPIQVGETTSINCNAMAEEGHNATISFQTSSGQIAPHDNRATLTGTAAGPVTVTASVVDDRQLSAQTSVSVDVQAPAPPAQPSTLNELIFKQNSPYVDNRAKAALDDDALRLERDPNSTVILEGSTNPSEKDSLAQARADNAKTYLTSTKGIDATRIQTRAAQQKTGSKVNIVLVPAGATAPQ